MLEATFGDIYPDEDSAWARQKKAVDWCEQRVKASEWVVERCGNLYTELQVPRSTPLADMQKLATKYVREFHKAVDWCEQRVKASEWVVERCGNLYTELQVPRSTPLADMQKLATKYVREFHPDKVNRLANISKDVKDAWVSDHSARVSSMRECFTDAVTRFFYDRALNTKTAAVPIFRHMTPNVPRLAMMTAEERFGQSVAGQPSAAAAWRGPRPSAGATQEHSGGDSVAAKGRGVPSGGSAPAKALPA